MALLMLGRRCGLPGPAGQAQLEAMDVETLEGLCVDLLEFTGPADLAAWLAAHPAP